MKIKNKLACLGDLHSNLTIIYDYIDRFDINNTSIIQVGDLGYGFTNYQLVELDEYLQDTNNNLFVVRGNHDNLYNHIFKDGYTEYDILHYIKFLQDYEILEWQSKKILTIGGAISIDRLLRIKNYSWWEKEAVHQVDIDTIPKDIDIVVSHTNPSSFEPHTFNALCEHYFENDPELPKELIEEREYMQMLFEYINPKLWCHGHMHFSKKYYLNNCKVVALGINELYQIHLT